MTYHPYIQPEFNRNKERPGCAYVLEDGRVCGLPPEHPDHDPVLQNVTPKVDKNSKPTI